MGETLQLPHVLMAKSELVPYTARTWIPGESLGSKEGVLCTSGPLRCGDRGSLQAEDHVGIDTVWGWNWLWILPWLWPQYAEGPWAACMEEGSQAPQRGVCGVRLAGVNCSSGSPGVQPLVPWRQLEVLASQRNLG